MARPLNVSETMKEIVLRKEHLEEIIAHSREVSPKEACGVLGGRENAVERVIRLRNVEDSEVTYSLDPREQNRAFKELQGQGLRMVGIYHSHTGSPAYPSQTDIRRAFFPGTAEPNFPGTAYVIVSLAAGEPVVRAFLIGSEGVRELGITVG